MTDETTFHTIFIFLYAAVAILRLYYHWLARTYKSGIKNVGGRSLAALQELLALPVIGGFLLYIFVPESMAWASLPLPSPLRWLGAVLGAVSLPFLFWVQRALGKNFSTQLRIRADHRLVTHGPYRWVRHPMYTVLLVFAVGLFLLLANWFVGGAAVLGIALVMIIRTPYEEQMMLEAFGDEYRRYMERTGRFLPRRI